MANDDDEDLFDDDDDFLDEVTLAALDVIDAKHEAERAKRSQAAVAHIAPPPPAKRQRLAPSTSMDQLPEITVHGNGRYGIPQGGSTPFAPPASGARPPAPTRPPPAQAAPRRPPNRNHVPPANPARNPTRPPAPPPVPAPVSDTMQKQLEQLQTEKAAIQQSLKDATSAQYAKEGEAKLLRQNLEKAAKEHARTMAEAKAKIDEAGAKMAQMQREMKEEREKMQTQLAFKNQEYEAARKQSAVHRSQPRPHDAFTTPIRPLTQRNAVAGPSTVTSPTTVKREKKEPKLRGFQNAFTDATPLQSKTRKGKAPQAAAIQTIQTIQYDAPRSSPPSSPLKGDDTDMMDVFSDGPDPAPTSSTQTSETPLEADLDASVVDILPLDWGAELNRILLTHRRPSDTISSLQQFINAPIPHAFQADYHNIVTALLRDVGSHHTPGDYSNTSGAIASSLIALFGCFSQHNLLPCLLALLNLLCVSIYSLPSFTSILLSKVDDKDSLLMISLCKVITTHLHPPKDKPYPTELATEVVTFLEALCWNPVKEDAEKLRYMWSSRDIYAALLGWHHPTWMLIRVTHFLTLQLSYPQLAQHLLHIPPLIAKPPSEEPFPVLDRLCSFAIDANRQSREEMSFKESILGYIGQLSACTPDALKALSESLVLVPSLVVFITSLTTPMWQDDDALVDNPALVTSTVLLLKQTVYLLHRLIYFEDPPVDLRLKLHRAPVRHFLGISDMFTLTFGRLAFSATPEWVSDELRPEMTVISEFAQELLDLVIIGPDVDNVWKAFQEQDEDEDDMDTMEENLMGDDEDEDMHMGEG